MYLAVGTITLREHGKQINPATYVSVMQCLLQYDVLAKDSTTSKAHSYDIKFSSNQ
jgi:hypothetical protein